MARHFCIFNHCQAGASHSILSSQAERLSCHTLSVICITLERTDVINSQKSHIPCVMVKYCLVCLLSLGTITHHGFMLYWMMMPAEFVSPCLLVADITRSLFTCVTVSLRTNALFSAQYRHVCALSQ